MVFSILLPVITSERRYGIAKRDYHKSFLPDRYLLFAQLTLAKKKCVKNHNSYLLDYLSLYDWF